MSIDSNDVETFEQQNTGLNTTQLDPLVSRYPTLDQWIEFHTGTLNIISWRYEQNKKYVNDKRVNGLVAIRKNSQIMKKTLNTVTIWEIANKRQVRVNQLNKSAYHIDTQLYRNKNYFPLTTKGVQL